MADTWVKLAVPDYRRLKTVAEQVLGNTASHPCLRSSADSASFPDTICWRTLPDATDPTTKINVYNGVLFSKSKGWSTLPAGDLERFVEDTNFTSVTLPAAGEDETCVYLVWACKLTADTGDDEAGEAEAGDDEAGDAEAGDAEAGDAEAGAEYPGGLSIVADSAALTALQDRCDYYAVIALIFWDSTNDCGYRIAQRISSPLFLDTVAGDADKAVGPKPEGETSTALTQQESIITKNGSLQLFGFDPESDAATLGPGLLKLLKVDHPEKGTPKLAAAGESDTIWLVAQRVNGDYRGIVYIPLNSEEATDTHKPDGPDCVDQNEHPGGGGGGDGSDPEDADHPQDEDEDHPGDDDNGTGGDTGNGQHPAADDCYTTAA
jgi:hypothetical protein